MAALRNLKEVRGVRGAIYRLHRAAFALRGAANFAALRREVNGRKPSITAVVVGRNDDYMSDFADRLRATIAWNSNYLVQEVVFVEWNPPGDRELLSTDLVKQFDNLRAYVVAPEIRTVPCSNFTPRTSGYAELIPIGSSPPTPMPLLPRTWCGKFLARNYQITLCGQPSASTSTGARVARRKLDSSIACAING